MTNMYQRFVDAMKEQDLAEAINCLDLSGEQEEHQVLQMAFLLEAIVAGSIDIVRHINKTNRNILSDAEAVKAAVLTAPSCAVREIVELVLCNGADVNMTLDEEAGTFLHMAAVRMACGCPAGSDLVQQYLDSHNANMNLLNKNKETALMLALRVQPYDGHTMTMVNKLVSAGVDVNAKDEMKGTLLHTVVSSNSYFRKTMQAYQGCTAGSSLDWSEHAAYQCELLQHLVESGVSVNAPDREGMLPLSKYLSEYREDQVSSMVVRKLCALGSDVNFCTLQSGLNSWHMAAFERRLEIMQVLYQYGTDINKPTRQQNKNVVHCMLQGSCQRSRGTSKAEWEQLFTEVKNCIDYFVSIGVDMNHTDLRGRTPLHHYIADDHCVPDPRVVEYLLNKGTLYFLVDNYSESPLTSACKAQWTHVTHVLLRLCPGLCVNYGANTEPNPLHRMIVYGAVTRLQQCQHRRKQNSALTDKCIRMLKMLLEAGYYLTEEDLTMFNNNAIASPVVELLKYECSNAPRLSRLCKGIVRKVLWDRLNHRVAWLPVPNRIKSSILLQDF